MRALTMGLKSYLTTMFWSTLSENLINITNNSERGSHAYIMEF